jgi:hypothetical protein
MANGVLVETTTNTTSGTRCAYFPYISRVWVTYEVRKLHAIFFVVVLNKAGESQPRAPGQNDDLWTRAPVPLEIADDKQYTNILPRFPGPSEHSGPRVFCPPPLAGLGFENTNGLWFVYKTKLTLEIKRTFKRHLEISKGPFTRAIFAAISVAIFYSFTSSKRRKSQLKSQQKSPV